MRALILIALLAFTAFAVRVPKNNLNKMVEELQKTKQGATLLHMVQLHAMAQGPVQELEDAIEELISDLTVELTDLDSEFSARTAEYDGDVISFNQDINDASTDVATSDDSVNNLFLPRQAQLSSRLDSVQENAVENRETVDEETLIREQENEAYEAQVEELNEATAAVDEALVLLDSLQNPSLLQIKKFQNSLVKIQAKINKRGRLAPMIKALVTLASNQNFVDQEAVQGIIDLLNDFRNAVVDTLNDLTLSENESAEEFEDRVRQLNAEFAEFQMQINELSFDLTSIAQKIEDVSQFANARAVDLKSYEAQLELENTVYAEETEIYTDLKNQYLRELAVTEQALGLVQNYDFSSLGL